MWMTPALISAWIDTQGGTRPAWLDEPLLRDLYSSDQIEEYWGRPLARRTPQEVERSRNDFQLQASNAMKLRAAGMRIVEGTDTGQTRFFIGYFNHVDLESMVAMGLTPAEAIVAGTRDAAEIGKFNAGLVAAGKSADFIVLDANPLERIGNSRRINEVYLRGQKVDRAGLRAKWQAERNQTTKSSLK
jgi:predicted amidohydrolase YtcJ